MGDWKLSKPQAEELHKFVRYGEDQGTPNRQQTALEKRGLVKFEQIHPNSVRMSLTEAGRRAAGIIPDLTDQDLVTGALYRGKQPRPCRNGEMNDRVILWIGMSLVQYDSNSVANGRGYPKVPIDEFLAWVSHRVNEDGTPFRG